MVKLSSKSLAIIGWEQPTRWTGHLVQTPTIRRLIRFLRDLLIHLLNTSKDRDAQSLWEAYFSYLNTCSNKNKTCRPDQGCEIPIEVLIAITGAVPISSVEGHSRGKMENFSSELLIVNGVSKELKIIKI